jgi:hypothetical protein
MIKTNNILIPVNQCTNMSVIEDNSMTIQSDLMNQIRKLHEQDETSKRIFRDIQDPLKLL